jgi:16S rRNA (adenine1518-N6/adenine1519-N6)-dimethyltransferase
MSISDNISIIQAIHDLPPLREVVAEHSLTASKVFGQNYLFDLNLTRRIARSCRYTSSDSIIFEIGPGPGGLTRALLLETDAHIIAIEKDVRFITALQPLVDAAGGRLQIINQDALTANLRTLADGKNYTIASNLPYNIGTELLIRWLHDIQMCDEMILMFQQEVAERIAGKINSKAYGRLSVLSQALCSSEILFKVPASAFTPPPKVTSAIIRLRPLSIDHRFPVENLPFLEELTAAAFGQRRKMLRQSLKSYLNLMDSCGLDTTLRAEDLTVADYLKLADKLKEEVHAGN